MQQQGEPVSEFNRYSLYLKKTTEVLAIIIISLGTLLFSLTAKSSRLGISLFLSGVAIFIYIVIRKSKTVHPFFSYVVLWSFWLAHSYMLRDYGLTGMISFLYSLVLFVPFAVISIFERPQKIIAYRKFIIMFMLIMVSIIPNSDANAIMATPLISFLRCMFSIIIYVFLVFRYAILGLKMHAKYGIVIMSHLIYAFMSHITVTVTICSIQIVFLSWMCVRKTALTRRIKDKDGAGVEEGDEDLGSDREDEGTEEQEQEDTSEDE